MSPRAVRTFITGDSGGRIRQKFVGHPELVDRAMVTLATNRGLLLTGEPGTAKSLLSELLGPRAISGRSTVTIQGSAGTTEDHVKYSWNYALLLAEGATLRALVPAPVYTGMAEGALVRFEELTRCPQEVQDCLLSILSDRHLTIPDMRDTLFARDGFNIIATANTRDRGTNDMSAALKRRFNFETVFPIPDLETELQLVRDESTRLLQASGVPHTPATDVLEVLVTTFRELRSGLTTDGHGMERVSSSMSTAEAVSVAYSIGIRAWYLRQARPTGADVVDCMSGAAVKDSPDDVARIQRYFEEHVSRRPGEAWQALYQARHRLR